MKSHMADPNETGRKGSSVSDLLNRLKLAISGGREGLKKHSVSQLETSFQIADDRGIIDAYRQLDRLDFVLPCWEYFLTDYSPSVVNIKEVYDGNAIKLSQDIPTSDIRIMAHMIHAGLPENKPLGQKSVVEFGSGCGFLTAWECKLGYGTIHGVEINSDLVRISRESLANASCTLVSIHEDNMMNWISDKGTFDTIIVSFAVNDRAVLDKLLDHINPDGGKLVIPWGQRRNGSIYEYMRVDGKARFNVVYPEVYFVEMVR